MVLLISCLICMMQAPKQLCDITQALSNTALATADSKANALAHSGQAAPYLAPSLNGNKENSGGVALSKSFNWKKGRYLAPDATAAGQSVGKAHGMDDA